MSVTRSLLSFRWNSQFPHFGYLSYIMNNFFTEDKLKLGPKWTLSTNRFLEQPQHVPSVHLYSFFALPFDCWDTCSTYMWYYVRTAVSSSTEYCWVVGIVLKQRKVIYSSASACSCQPMFWRSTQLLLNVILHWSNCQITPGLQYLRVVCVFGPHCGVIYLSHNSKKLICCKYKRLIFPESSYISLQGKAFPKFRAEIMSHRKRKLNQ